MKLRTKLVLAQVPLALVLAIVGVLSASVTSRLGASVELILANNYRSVLAVQTMQNALEAMDRTTLFIVAGRTLAGPATEAELGGQQRRFAAELAVQKHNITEPGEREVTLAMEQAWNAYRDGWGRFRAMSRPAERDAFYFSDLALQRDRIKQMAERILAINQDAMVRKSARAESSVAHFQQVVLVVVFLGLALGLLGSAGLTSRLLRPLGVVTGAVRRFGEGDLAARAEVGGRDEITAVATEFNRMAERLQKYRASSLGELLQAEQAAQAAIDGLPDPVLLLDANGQMRGANTAAIRLIRVSPERPAGEQYSETDPAVRALVDRLRGFVLSGRGSYQPKGFEDALHVNVPGDGERIFLPRAMPIYGELGAVTGVAVALQDATRLFRFDELKNNLVATVAHEFRTPLTSLRMALHLCTEEVVGPLTPKQSDLLFAAREDCDRLQAIVDDLLNLSRIESGRIDLYRRRVDPEALVHLAADVHRQAAEQSGITLRFEVPPGLPHVFADPDRLQLVFTNLIGNALRYSPRDSHIVLRARAWGTPSKVDEHRVPVPPFVRFEIADRGPGISPEHQAGLFEKFFRVPGSPEGGSGLGLFIARGLVQAHEGQIGVDTQIGQGATFWFTIPAAPELGEEQAALGQGPGDSDLDRRRSIREEPAPVPPAALPPVVPPL
jgi:NtrC-family two-component system sensor histidine kinase KinB